MSAVFSNWLIVSLRSVKAFLGEEGLFTDGRLWRLTTGAWMYTYLRTEIRNIHLTMPRNVYLKIPNIRAGIP